MTGAAQPDLFRAGEAGVQDGGWPFRGPAHPPEGSPLRRLRDHGPRALLESEALTLLLERCAPDCHAPAAAAAALLRRFGCWPRVFGASEAELAPIVGAPVAADLTFVHDLLLQALAFKVRKRDVLSSWTAVSAYLRAALAGQARESFHVLFLDKANGLIADELMGQGTVDHAPVYPREVMRRALELNASACLLVHNHPAGGSSPSRADIDMTRAVVEAGRALGIAVHDHYLVAGDEVVSFQALRVM